MTLKDMGLLDESIAELRTALRLQPSYLDAHSNLLYTLHCHPGEEPASIFAEHVAWGRRYGDPLAGAIRPHGNERAPERRLRIGYVSPDFRSHVVGLFMLPILEAHDPAGFEVLCYGSGRAQDATTGRIRERAAWRDIVGLGDAEAAELIRRDAVDLLVDLTGHTAGHRLLLFARKPAPVQVTYLGYPGTTGLAAMDYRITDAHADPPGLTDRLYTETLVRLPDTAWCYAPPPDAPAVGRGPAADGRALTFGSFNNLAKLTGTMLGLWAEILRAVPGSRLLLKNAGFGSATARQRVRAALAAEGIEPKRVELRGPVLTPAGHLAAYAGVDIALDTYPYHGTTTTCEALYMGVPVVSLAGQTHVSRVGASLLANVGLTELVASSPDEYVQRAVGLARDGRRLSALRGSLRGLLERSALMDAGRFTRHLEQAYRDMWQRHQAGLPPAPIRVQA
jgi:predicted O-linked N-acetylglucosamine transferase (SPINDLY family)